MIINLLSEETAADSGEPSRRDEATGFGLRKRYVLGVVGLRPAGHAQAAAAKPSGRCSPMTRSGTRYERSAAHDRTTCSGTASNSRGFSCITYSFSMWYDSLTNFLKAASPALTPWSSVEAMRKI